VTSDETLELLESAVALRVEGRNVPERVRRTLAAVESRLVDVIGPVVRKRVAARLLGCSVQALDRWIAKGAIPVQPISDDAKRIAIATDSLVGIAAEQQFERRLGAAVERARERRWREVELQSACNLISFATSIEVSAWHRERAS
jgi:hypothetical protein